MIQEYEMTETTKKYKRLCDVCKTEIKRDLQCSVAKCKICGIDLCDKCVEYEDEDHDTGDYRIVYCKTCWDKEVLFRQQILELEEEIDSFYDEWHNSIIFLR